LARVARIRLISSRMCLCSSLRQREEGVALCCHLVVTMRIYFSNSNLLYFHITGCLFLPLSQPVHFFSHLFFPRLSLYKPFFNCHSIVLPISFIHLFNLMHSFPFVLPYFVSHFQFSHVPNIIHCHIFSLVQSFIDHSPLLLLYNSANSLLLFYFDLRSHSTTLHTSYVNKRGEARRIAERYKRGSE